MFNTEHVVGTRRVMNRPHSCRAPRLQRKGGRAAVADMSGAFEAAWWGFVAGAALLIGAAAGYLAPVPRRLTATIMAFGAGVLISALSFDLMDEAYRQGGFDSTAAGFIGGAAIYTAANWLLARRGAKHRK